MKKKAIIQCILMVSIVLTFSGCLGHDNPGPDKGKERLNTCFDELGIVSCVVEYEMNDVFIIEDSEQIEQVKTLIFDNITAQVSPQDDDELSPPPGAPLYAARLDFFGEDDTHLAVFVDDSNLSYPLVCKLYRGYWEEITLCFETESVFFHKIQTIMHKGSKMAVGSEEYLEYFKLPKK